MSEHKCSGRYVGGYRAGEPCPYVASAIVNVGPEPFRVCGYHARAYASRVVYRLDWSMARVHDWQLANLDALVSRGRA